MNISVQRTCAFCLLLACSVTACAQSSDAGDQDRDGGPDHLEQALLEKFRPTFMISPFDCDRQPAEFRTGLNDAIVLDRNGAIYGQVFRPPATALGEAALEVHYYHLWGRD